MDNATVASMQGTVGRTDAGSAPGIACQQMPLSFLKGGEPRTIAKARGRGDLHHHLENLGLAEGALKRHIMDMGITKGTSVFVRKVAPLGDPIEVTVRGYELSLRKSEAESILIG